MSSNIISSEGTSLNTPATLLCHCLSLYPALIFFSMLIFTDDILYVNKFILNLTRTKLSYYCISST